MLLVARKLIPKFVGSLAPLTGETGPSGRPAPTVR